MNALARNALACFFRRVDDENFFRALAPTLSIGGAFPLPPPIAGDPLRGQAAQLCTDGYLQLPAAISSAQVHDLVVAVDALHVAGLPPVFAYVYDDFWHPTVALDAVAQAAIGPFDVLDDVWAWHIDAGVGNAGWSPHRGRDVWERQSDGRPGTLNVWIALTDVPASGCCMHIVPLGDDPFYPADLNRIDVDPRGAHALPVTAGTALAWDANVLHWGGRNSTPDDPTRVSLSFTLRSRAAARLPGTAAVQPATLSFRSRLDLIAQQILTYAPREPGFPVEVVEWARTTTALLMAQGAADVPRAHHRSG